MNNYFFINYQNGNGNINKQNPKKMDGLEKKIRNLEEKTEALKTIFFEIQNNIKVNENWPQLSSLQMN